jgi:hypothetical protein
MVRTDMAPTSSDFGVVRRRTRRPTGTIMALAMPWKRRAATSWFRFWAKPQAMEAVAKRTMETMKMRLAPNRSAIQPLTGRKTAEASRNMVMARFMLRGSSCRDLAMVGKALEITVAVRVCMSMAEPMMAGTIQPLTTAAMGSTMGSSRSNSLKGRPRGDSGNAPWNLIRKRYAK